MRFVEQASHLFLDRHTHRRDAYATKHERSLAHGTSIAPLIFAQGVLTHPRQGRLVVRCFILEGDDHG
jgi:hypothetical protein